MRRQSESLNRRHGSRPIVTRRAVFYSRLMEEEYAS